MLCWAISISDEMAYLIISACRHRARQLDELIDTDNVIAASVVCIEFINMMAAIDRIAEAAHMLGYLEAANDFGALAARTLVTEATDKIAATVRHGSGPTPASVRHIDDRAALDYMRDVLAELAPPHGRAARGNLTLELPQTRT